jgi:NAD-dependent deacetylase
VWYDDLTGRDQCPSYAIEGRLRPHVIWCGEMPLRLDPICQVLADCRLFVAIGASENVEPAAGFVEEARRAEATPSSSAANPRSAPACFAECIYGPTSEIVPRYLSRLIRADAF